MSDFLFPEREEKTSESASGKTPENKSLPLAARLSPDKLCDFSGQEHLLSPGKLLRRAIEADQVTSAIFFGPPGCGKTALACYIAGKTKSHTEELNAAICGVAELKKLLNRALKLRTGGFSKGRKTLLILDEIHHFNRTQQDVLLPSVERGEIILIGLTSENPYFYVNTSLLSRFSVFEFKPLDIPHLSKILDRAVHEKEPGLGAMNLEMTPEARNHLLNNSGGDARKLLNAVELAALTTQAGPDGKRIVTLEIAEESIQKRSLRYDKSSDEHYDHISAFIKSMRGCDPDAALYWMAKMLTAGEDPRFIARRILICASEDVGNADPLALMLAVSVFHAVELVGMPEAKIPLAQAAVYVASAPKSNASYLGILSAADEVENGPTKEVPNHLRDSNLDSKTRGHGKGYLYPHDYPGHFVKQEYMPHPKQFYKPTDQGAEAEISKRLKKWEK